MANVERQQAAEESGRSLELIANLARLFWDDVADRITLLVKTLIEEFLEARRTEALGAGSYERTVSRRGHQGGSYGQWLKTTWGEVELRVPRMAEGSYDLDIVDRWGRRHADLDEAIGSAIPGRGVHPPPGAGGRGAVGHRPVQGPGLGDHQDPGCRSGSVPRPEDPRHRAVPPARRAHCQGEGGRGQGQGVPCGLRHPLDGRREIPGVRPSRQRVRAGLAGLPGRSQGRGLKGKALKLITVYGAWAWPKE
jgi:hypothetical protein